MCFSAGASFAAAAVIGAVGVAGARAVREPREWVLATLPLAFALHQLAEGLTWQQLSGPGDVCRSPTVTGWAVFAWAVVPVWLALGVLLVETQPRRLLLMRATVALGLVTAPFWLAQALRPEVEAVALQGHLVYPLPDPGTAVLIPAYLVVVLAPPLLSSHIWLRRLGVGGLASAALVAAVSLLAWPSLWCFAAAGLSCLVAAHLTGVRTSGAPPVAPSPRRAESPQTGDAPSP